jgi:hypothetical protein
MPGYIPRGSFNVSSSFLFASRNSSLERVAVASARRRS